MAGRWNGPSHCFHLPCRQMEQHKQGLSQAQQEHENALRSQKEIDAQQHKLGSHLDKARAHANQANTTVQQHTDSECKPS